MDSAGHAMPWTLDKKKFGGPDRLKRCGVFPREGMSLAAGRRTWAGTLTPLLGAAALSSPLLLLVVVGIQYRFTVDTFFSKEVDIFFKKPDVFL